MANRDAINQRASEKRAADPEKHREEVRKHRAAHPEAAREYYEKNHEKNLARMRKRDPQKRREEGARYRAKYPEKMLEQRKVRAKWAVDNADRVRENGARWRAENKERIRERIQKLCADESNRIRLLVGRAKIRARKRGLEFDGLAEIAASLPTKCLCCGYELDYTKTGPINVCGMRWPSLDRLRSDEGYISRNVRVICWRCNTLKRDSTVEELETIVAYMRREIEGSLM
jgi:hypothetical protein